MPAGADSMRAMRKRIIDRDIRPVFQNRLLTGISVLTSAPCVARSSYAARRRRTYPRHREAGLRLRHLPERAKTASNMATQSELDSIW